jgi:hypothetical protein
MAKRDECKRFFQQLNAAKRKSVPRGGGNRKTTGVA